MVVDDEVTQYYHNYLDLDEVINIYVDRGEVEV